MKSDQIGTFASLPRPHAYCNPLKLQKKKLKHLIKQWETKVWSDSHYLVNIIVYKTDTQEKGDQILTTL